MNRRILIVEPDASGRAMIDRVLAAEGYAPTPAASVHEVAALLDEHAFSLAIVDEMAGRGAVLEELRWLRRNHPGLPVIASGALLSQRVMQELLRLHVADSLLKPYTPDALREAVARSFAERSARRDEALEYDATVGAGRAALAAGKLGEARAALGRALAIAPFDAEIMALLALGAELGGRDDDADRGYRAALALRQHEDSPPPDPHEGLARLGAYGRAVPVTALRPERAGEKVRIALDPARDLALSAARPGAPVASVILLALGLGDPPGAAGPTFFLRDGAGGPAFVLLTAALRPEAIAAAMDALGLGAVLPAEGGEGLDLDRIASLRRERRP
ncbi:MAG: response regulator [Byssovorax sp.]